MTIVYLLFALACLAPFAFHPLGLASRSLLGGTARGRRGPREGPVVYVVVVVEGRNRDV